MRVIFCGRHNTRWWITLVAPHIINNVLYMTRINYESHFAWRASTITVYSTV